MIPSLSTLQFDADGFFGHTRAIERIALALDGLGGSVGDNNAKQGETPGSAGDAPLLAPGIFTLATVQVGGSGAIVSVTSGTVPTSGVTAGSYGAPSTAFKVPYFTVDAYGALTAAAEYSIPYIGTLAVPVFGGAVTVVGNAAGSFAVDWQQSRNAATQVASGLYATIPGGRNNTASGQTSFAAGVGAVASGTSDVAFSGTASGGLSVAFGGTASGLSAVSFHGTASGNRGFAVSGTASGSDCFSFGESSGVISTNINGTNCFGYNAVSSASSNRSLFLNSGASSHTLDNSEVIGGFAFDQLGTTDPQFVAGGLVSAFGNYQFGAGSVLITALYANGATKRTPVLVGTTFSASSAQSITMSYSQLFGVDVGSGVSDVTALRSIFSALTSTRTYTSSQPLISVSDSVVIQSANASVGIANYSGVITLGGSGSAGGAFGCHGTYSGSAQVLIGLDNGTTTDPATSDRVQIASTLGVWGTLRVTGAFGCNTKAPQTALASGGAVTQTAGATYTATEQAMLGSLKTLANNIRTALVNNGIMS